ncbi:hypothetical protein DENSPDRAFT_844876 [Dentipellis sp. KUC8613]|nr:hypothetical protein DENSPDRAFT_844876 [Dentipellis sp. KUC8613]
MNVASDILQRTPPELWLSIFEHATFVPHAFDTDVADPFDVPGAPIPFDTQIEDNLRSSFATKRSLVLVCKLWHDLAMPLLYQAVAARDNHSLKSLRDTLTQYENNSTAQRNHKIQVRRLDLSSWPADEREVTPDLPIGLFAHLPHLEIFCIWDHDRPAGSATNNPRRRYFTIYEVYSIIHDLLDSPACKASLRKCILSSPSVYMNSYNALATECRQLSCLLSPSHARGVAPETQIIPDSQFLTALSIDSVCEGGPVGADMQPWSRPLASLRNVHITLFSLSNGRKVGMEAFFRIQGAHLRTVQLDMRYCATSDCVEFYLGILATYCPNLTYLIFIRESRQELWPPGAFPPTVTHLGVYTNTQVPPRGLSDHLELMHKLAARGGKVPGVVRRLNALTEEEWKYLCRDADRHALYLSMPLPPHCRLEDAGGKDVLSLLRESPVILEPASSQGTPAPKPLTLLRRISRRLPFFHHSPTA